MEFGWPRGQEKSGLLAELGGKVERTAVLNSFDIYNYVYRIIIYIYVIEYDAFFCFLKTIVYNSMYHNIDFTCRHDCCVCFWSCLVVSGNLSCCPCFVGTALFLWSLLRQSNC